MARSGWREPKALSPARTLTVRIETIGSGGDGVAHDEGKTLYTAMTAPGDLAVVEARGDRGRLLELIERSPLRADPPCRHFGDCGGCALQHLAPAEQARWKQAQVSEALARERVVAGRIHPILTMPAASRRRAVFAATAEKAARCFGFNERRSHRVVAIAACDILSPPLSARLEALRALAAIVPAPAFDVAVTACDNGLDVNFAAPKLSPHSLLERRDLAARLHDARIVRLSVNGEPVMTLSPPSVLFDGVAVAPPPGAFLQASREGEAALIGLVKAAAEGARKIADLFSGCGTFALPLAKSASVSAIDSDRAAIEALKRAASAAQASTAPIHPLHAEVRDLFERPLTAKELKKFDLAVFDPPRAGAAAQAAEIAKSGVPRVVGVSCNQQSFARDASLLVAGGYRLLEVTPVDQFVYSPHIEIVGVFARE